MWTRHCAAAADLDRLVDRVEQAALLAADVAGVDAAVLGRRPRRARRARRSWRRCRGCRSGRWTCPRRRPACPGRRARASSSSSSGVGSDLPAAEHRRPHAPCGIRWTTFVPAPCSSISARYLRRVDGAAAAVAGDHRRAALADVVLGGRGLLRRRSIVVAVGVQVDEARGDDEARAVDRLADLARRRTCRRRRCDRREWPRRPRPPANPCRRAICPPRSRMSASTGAAGSGGDARDERRRRKSDYDSDACA